MKNMISTLVIACILSLNANADHRLSDLHIRKFDNAPVLVQLDNQFVNNPGPVKKINNLEAGRYRLKIWTIQQPSHYNHNYKRLLYNGFIDVPAGSEVRAMLTQNNTIRINQVIPNFVPVPVDPICNPYAPFNPTPIGYQSQHHLMSPAEFNALLNTIDNQNFESTKMVIAKQAIKDHEMMTTGQVVELINLLSFESSKLELAKFAYQYTVDRHKYFQLFNHFSFDSSVRALSDFMDRFS
ncbi:MAG: DUF4476 domain-containing protein [Bacteroidetes bacterium]|nr:DUF4476 domain-containing protein [Bacteroidota bacterium]